jgi:hypothetical protein
MYPPADVLSDFTFRHENLSQFDSDVLLNCLLYDTSWYKTQLYEFETGRRWSAQKRRQAAEHFKASIVNVLKRRLSNDGI